MRVARRRSGRRLSAAARAGAGGSGVDAPARRAVSGGAVLRLTAHGRSAQARRHSGRPPSGAPSDAADGSGGAGAEARDEPAGAGPSDLSLPVARPRDRAAEPGVGGRHHVHPDGPRLPVSSGDHRLVLAGGAGMAAVKHDGRRLLCRGSGDGADAFRDAGDLQHRSGRPVHQRRVHRPA